MPSSDSKLDMKVVIPETLRFQLEGFRRHLWRVKILEAIAAGVIGLLLSFLLVYGLDRVWQAPGWARLVILLGGVSLFAIFAPYWLHRWVWGQRREAQLARLIAKKFPGLGDRLLGVIELQDQHGNVDSLSPRLREAAMEAVAAETARRELREALPIQRHRRWAFFAGGLAVLTLIAFWWTPRAGKNAFERWLMPFSKTERYTFTKLSDAPSHLTVPYGEAFEISLTLADESEQRPSSATARYGLQPPIGSRLVEGSYRFPFPGQQDPGTAVFIIGDLRHAIHVEPVVRPGVETVAAVLTPPDYLGIPERTLDLKNGVLSAVEGSRVQFKLTANRALATAIFGPTREPVGAESADASPMVTQSGQLAVSGNTATTDPVPIGSAPFEVPFSWRDQLGIDGESGFSLRVEALRDLPPTCYLQGIDRQKVMLPEETVEFEVLAEDDFGVKWAGIEWSGETARPTGKAPAKGEFKLADGASEERRLMRPASFSPAAFGIEPQKIELRGYTEDFFPNRGRVYSEPVVIFVLTRDEHAQMLKNKFDRTITELEDLARREQELLDENRRLERLDGEQLQNEASADRLKNQQAAETESARRMEELTERMESLMKDAARNGDIEKDTLKKMAESLKSMQELAQKDLPQVEEKLSESSQLSNAPEKAQKDMADAVETQKKAVEKMQDAIQKANEANRQFEAGTFVNRLKKAADEQSEIASVLIDSYERTLGQRSSKLDPSDQRRLAETSQKQASTASDVRWIQEDLSHYFARTQTDSFKQILEEMRESQIDIGLEELRGLLGKNHTFTATEASKKWADQLTVWARKLEGEKDKNDSGGGGDSGGPSPEDEDFEFMLRVMKLIQQEQDLRAQTRALELLRRSSASIPNKTP